MGKPKITIGVCVRNGEDNIGDAIETILNQDFPHDFMEVIFVDDGSRDKTLSIIESYVPRMGMQVKVFHHEWKGLGHSRNVVVDNAEGDFILWVDSDMLLSKDFVKKLVEFMEQHPRVGIAKGRQVLQECGNLLGTLESLSRAAGRMVDYKSEKSLSKALGTGGAIYRVEAAKEVGGFDPNLKGYGEDWDIEIRIRALGWHLQTLNAEFSDYERYGLSWKKLWQRYWLRGYHMHHFLHKNRELIKHYRMFPPAAFLSGIVYAHKLYRLTHQNMVFLLPFQCMLKNTAWYIGFLASHMASYEAQQSHASPLRFPE